MLVSSDILGCSHCSSHQTLSRPGKDAVMSSFRGLLCNMILAHHILPAGSVEEVSAAAFSSVVSMGSLPSARRLPDNAVTSVLLCPLQTFTVSLSNSLSFCLFRLYPLFLLRYSEHKLPTPCLLVSICVCLWMRTASATSTTCGSTPCRTCWDTSTPTPSPLNPEARPTSRYAPTCKCSEAPLQVHNSSRAPYGYDMNVNLSGALIETVVFREFDWSKSRTFINRPFPFKILWYVTIGKA